MRAVSGMGFRSLSTAHLIGMTPRAWSAERWVGRSVAAEALSPVFVLQDVMDGEVTGSDTSLNIRKGFPLHAPCLSIYTRVFLRPIAKTAGMPIYPSANFRPFILFATPLNEVSGVAAWCSAILDSFTLTPFPKIRAARVQMEMISRLRFGQVHIAR